MQIGLIGLSQAGKTTFYNLLTGAAEENGVSAIKKVHVGSARVPDTRIGYLASSYKPRKTIYPQIQFKDLPGLTRGEKPAAFTARWLDEVRNADALVLVSRAFHSSQVSDLLGPPDPYRDLLELHTELLLADLESVEKRIARLEGDRKISKEAAAGLEILRQYQAALDEGRPPGSVPLEKEQRRLVEGSFLSEKPLIIAVNVDEGELKEGLYPGREKMLSFAAARGVPLIEICAQMEMEINRLPEEERGLFMADLGLNISGISRLARAAYDLLGLISFFTVGEDEVRAWTVHRGTSALKAAGKIHSDIERGFIRAEVFSYDHFREWGSTTRLKERGLIRLEGKSYQVQDGDIIDFRFNV